MMESFDGTDSDYLCDYLMICGAQVVASYL